MLKPVLVTAPASAPVTRDELKSWIVIDYDDHDTLLDAMIDAATGYFDGYTGVLNRAIMPQTWKQEFNGFQTRMRLPLAPLVSITSIKYYDDDNVQQTASSSLYSAFEDHLGLYVELLSGQSWPSAYSRTDAVEVTYQVGYADADSVPDPIKTVIKMHAATLYEFRESENMGQMFQTPIYDTILAPFRRLNL